MTYSGIFSTAGPVSIHAAQTSYFSAPESTLDPFLFNGNHLKPWVRNSVLSILMDHFIKHYDHPKSWVHAWLAGSGVSYQWSAQRSPSDLDCLVGIDYIAFRSSNPSYRGLSDSEISQMMNEEFNEHLHPSTENWQGKYELTFYVNPGATDITSINPYAAYNLIEDTWTVAPNPGSNPQFSKHWQDKADSDLRFARDIVSRYSKSLTDVKNATNPAHRVNAEVQLRTVLEHASTLYDEIHHGRRSAFSPMGAGYADFNNWRWQSAKKSGVIPVLKSLKEYAGQIRQETEAERYGLELPTTDVLIRRAAVYRY